MFSDSVLLVALWVNLTMIIGFILEIFYYLIRIFYSY